MKLRRKGSLAVGALVVCLLAAYADTDDPGRSPVVVPEIDLLLSLHQQSLYGYHENAGAGDKTRRDDKCSKGWIAFRAGPGDEPSGDFSLMACREDPGQWIFKGHPMCVVASKRETFSMETVGLDGKSRDLPNAHVPGVGLQVLSRTTFMYPVSWNGLLPGPCVGRSFRAMQTSI